MRPSTDLLGPSVALLMADHRSPLALAQPTVRGNNLTVVMAAYLNLAFCDAGPAANRSGDHEREGRPKTRPIYLLFAMNGFINGTLE